MLQILIRGKFLEDYNQFQMVNGNRWAIDHIRDHSDLHPGKIETISDEIDLCDHIWCDGRRVNDECKIVVASGEYCETCGKMREGNYTDVTFDTLSDYGDVFTIAEFTSACNDGAFIDYDGHGRYCVSPCGIDGYNNSPSGDELVESSKTVKSSDITSKKMDNRFSHVVWFNR